MGSNTMFCWVLGLILLVSVDAEVVVLNDENFDKLTSEGVWFVEFYAPWCGHCLQLAPTWEKLAQEMNTKNVKVAKIDATTNSISAERFGVQGYPTLKVLADNAVFEFSGTRTIENLSSFALGGFRQQDGIARPPVPGAMPLHSDVIVLDDTSFDDKMQAQSEASEEVWLVEFYAPWCGACQAFIPTYEKVATNFVNHDTIRIAKVDAVANTKLKDRFGISGYPTINLFHKGRYYPFNGERKYEFVVKFVEGQYKGTRSFPVPANDTTTLKEDPIDPESDVIVLHDSDFEEKVKMGFEGDWFVEFYATWCGHCKQLKPVWEILATTLKKENAQVKVAKIEANSNLKSSQRFGVSGFPTLVLIHEGQYYDYSGARTLGAMKDFALGGYRNATAAPVQFTSDRPSLVRHLDDSNLEHLTQAATGATTGDWLIDFHASWCKPCHLWRPILEYAADSLQGQMSVAEIDSSVNPESQARFGITHYPTFLLLSNGKMYKYNGTRDLKSLVRFASKSGPEFAKAKVYHVPPVPTFAERLQIHLGHNSQEAYLLYKHNAFVALLIIVAGILVGAIPTAILGKLLMSEKKTEAKPKVGSPTSTSGKSKGPRSPKGKQSTK